MSMNIIFVAQREVTVNRTGKTSVQEEEFDCVWQTPTNVSYDIKNSADPIQAYKDWVMTFSEDKEWPIYADDDIWCEKEPIGFDIINDAKYHIERLENWIKVMEEEGFTIQVEVV